jgi:hypothetical protein
MAHRMHLCYGMKTVTHSAVSSIKQIYDAQIVLPDSENGVMERNVK